MKYSYAATALLLSLNLVSAAPAPGIHTVFVTQLETVINTIFAGGDNLTPIQTATQTEAQPEATSVTSAEAEETSTAAAEETPETTAAPIESTYATTSSASTTSTSSTSSSASTSSSSSSSGSHSGEGTYYSTGLGACGGTNKDSDKIVAISQKVFDANTTDDNSNDNSYCGKKIKASYKGKSVTVEVVDSCVGCAEDDLDFSPSAFSEIADQDLGRIDITWEWVN